MKLISAPGLCELNKGEPALHIDVCDAAVL